MQYLVTLATRVMSSSNTPVHIFHDSVSVLVVVEPGSGFLDGCNSHICLLLVLKDKGQLLKSATEGLREQEVDEHVLKGQPGAVEDQPAPLDVVQADRVNECGKEICKTAPKLEVSYPTGPFCEGPQFNEVGVG